MVSTLELKRKRSCLGIQCSMHRTSDVQKCLHLYTAARQEKLLTHVNDTHLRCLNFDFKLPEGFEWQIKAYRDFLLEMQ